MTPKRNPPKLKMTRQEWAIIHHALTQLRVRVVGVTSHHVRAAISHIVDMIGPDGHLAHARGTVGKPDGELMQEDARGA